MKQTVFLVSLIFSFCVGCPAQILNCYAKVTAIASPTINVTNVNESFDTFEDGEQIVIIQMQDDVIGANTLDDANFGNLSSVASAGLYEVRTIISHTEFAGLPVTITLNAAFTNAYNTGANSSVQIVSFRNMGTPINYTTAANISALAWNGNVGGVIALNIPGTLTLAHNINANGLGFVGGARSNNFYIGGTACYNTPFRTNNNQDGFKGESIYKSTTAIYTNSRAKILNGGGGGVQINAGGGGGGNYTGGGTGGYGWNATATGCTFAAGGFGFGGLALSTSINPTRVFMGGGGGGGQQNDGLGSNGANGGGIILIKANQLITAGTCGVLTISANGETPGNSGNDGAGGGGAGGSIVLNINNFSVAATCPLSINADGGNGGNVNSSTHAGGGAGGQGYVAYSIPLPTVNITTTTANGTAGCNNSALPCTNLAGAATGASNSGIVASVVSPLPIALLSFSVQLCNTSACIEWQTATEVNNDFFTIEKSNDALQFETIGRINGKGNSESIQNYAFKDNQMLNGISYYRLKQSDFNGAYSYSNIEMINLVANGLFDFKIYPNSSKGEKINIELLANKGERINLAIFDALTKVCYQSIFTMPLQGQNSFVVPLNKALPVGVYTIMVQSQRKLYNGKLIVE